MIKNQPEKVKIYLTKIFELVYELWTALIVTKQKNFYACFKQMESMFLTAIEKKLKKLKIIIHWKIIDLRLIKKTLLINSLLKNLDK